MLLLLRVSVLCCSLEILFGFLSSYLSAIHAFSRQLLLASNYEQEGICAANCSIQFS
jgi:hypothetical protein